MKHYTLAAFIAMVLAVAVAGMIGCSGGSLVHKKILIAVRAEE